MRTIWFLPIIFGMLLCGCYRAPTDDDCITLPRTNNPTLIKKNGQPEWLPSGQF